MTGANARLAALAFTAMLGGTLATPALAWDDCKPAQKHAKKHRNKKDCNSGRGNGSEGCDPGRSSTSPTGDAGQNQGGDEGGPIRGGQGAP